MIGNGQNKRHPIYIKDMTTAFIKAMQHNAAIGETMIIGGSEVITTAQLVESFSTTLDIHGPILKIPYPAGKFAALTIETLYELIKKEPPVSMRSLEFFNTNNAFSIEKAKRLLEFKPVFNLSQGLRDAISWFRSL